MPRTTSWLVSPRLASTDTRTGRCTRAGLRGRVEVRSRRRRPARSAAGRSSGGDGRATRRSERRSARGLARPSAGARRPTAGESADFPVQLRRVEVGGEHERQGYESHRGENRLPRDMSDSDEDHRVHEEVRFGVEMAPRSVTRPVMRASWPSVLSRSVLSCRRTAATTAVRPRAREPRRDRSGRSRGRPRAGRFLPGQGPARGRSRAAGRRISSRSSRPARLGSGRRTASGAAFSVATGTAIDRRYSPCGSHGLDRGRRGATAHVRARELPGCARLREPGRRPRRGGESPPGHRDQLPGGDASLVDAHRRRDHRSRPRARREDGRAVGAGEDATSAASRRPRGTARGRRQSGSPSRAALP